MSEFQLVSNVVERIAGEFPHLPFCMEVPMLGRSIDLVFIKGNKTYGIEFKLTAWRRAITQASDYKLACDFSFICLPENRVTSHVLDEAKKCQVGVMAYCPQEKWPLKVVLPTSQSKEKWARAARDLRRYVLRQKEGLNAE